MTGKFIRNAVIALLILGVVYTTSAKVGVEPKRTDMRASVLLIPVVSDDTVLELIAQGKRVVFVDAREKQEFDEQRIPGAINITLREVNSLTPEMIGDADLVVGYCLKDFRGYEVAKALRNAGVKNVHTLKTPGLNGWKQAKLPIYDSVKTTDADAIRELASRAHEKARFGEVK